MIPEPIYRRFLALGRGQHVDWGDFIFARAPDWKDQNRPYFARDVGSRMYLTVDSTWKQVGRDRDDVAHFYHATPADLIDAFCWTFIEPAPWTGGG